MKIKIAKTETKNFSFFASYEVSKTDEFIRSQFIEAAKKHIKQIGSEFDSEYWELISQDMQINTVSLNTWYRDNEEI